MWWEELMWALLLLVAVFHVARLHHAMTDANVRAGLGYASMLTM